ncbi:hypothetical protein I2I05_19160 [Hymenobacter sp. BT683]|uniref:DUF3098 domain-containing protein n=1 Tax=Hymenobacter jeongseonensis TaxID=2791027 RepID=A0ABS0IMC3_9BACT|nr:hypothetical protein [Hymenobacter jeongseonensis]MBF9239521.1 hypothetical protein [Hymenobacter jeongseonensis]
MAEQNEQRKEDKKFAALLIGGFVAGSILMMFLGEYTFSGKLVGVASTGLLIWGVVVLIGDSK